MTKILVQDKIQSTGKWCIAVYSAVVENLSVKKSLCIDLSYRFEKLWISHPERVPKITKIYPEASILRTHAPGGTKCGGSLPRMWIRTRTKLTHIAEDKNIDTKLPALTVCAWDFIGRLSFRYTARD